MLWRRKQADKPAAGTGDVLEPAVPGIPLDQAVFGSKLEQLLAAMEEQGGLEAFLESLTVKHQLFAQVLAEEAVSGLDREAVETLLATVFTARRKLPAVLFTLPQADVNAAIRELLYGSGELKERMQRFVELVPLQEGDDKDTKRANVKLQRAAWDFAAEMLHFRSPETYPLMSRWVWDINTVSGAMREFIAGNDALREVPFDARPETFEGVRHWMAEQLGTSGFYRDVHFLIDMVLAWAYADYMRAMSSSMGLIESEFGGKQDPTEPMRKLLGIDSARRSGQSRIKRETVH